MAAVLFLAIYRDTVPLRMIMMMDDDDDDDDEDDDDDVYELCRSTTNFFLYT